jgi:hypothetical protein
VTTTAPAERVPELRPEVPTTTMTVPSTPARGTRRRAPTRSATDLYGELGAKTVRTVQS